MHKVLLVVLLAVLSTKSPAALSAADLLAAGRADDSLSLLQDKVRSSPNDALSYNLLCRTYFQLGNWDQGIKACEKAVALAPDNSEYQLWMGRVYGEKADSASFLSAAGLAKKCRIAFEAAVRLDPKNIDARTDLAEFYIEAPGIIGGGRDKAEAQANALVPLHAGMAHWLKGRIAEKAKDLATAEKEYRAAIDATQGKAHAWFNLALYYRHQKRFDQMEEAVNHVATAPIDRPEVVMESAEVLLGSDRGLKTATQLLRRYLSSPTVEQAPAFKAHYLLGTALEKQGDKEGAASEYRAALALAKDYSRAKEALNRLGP